MILALLLGALCACGDRGNGIKPGTPDGTRGGSSEDPLASKGLSFTLSSDGRSYTVTGNGDCNATDIRVPKIHEGLPVTRIGDEAFKWCQSLESLTLPNSITSIGDAAFEGCTSLTSITLPENLASIGRDAFYGCSSLSYHNYGNAYYLGNGANPYHALICATSESISSCTIHEKTKVIAGRAFSHCAGLESLKIPEGVMSIGEDAFYRCSALTSITLPESLVSIGGEGAFADCTSLVFHEYDGAYYLGNSKNPYHALIKAKDTYAVSCILNEKTKVISGGAFRGCRNLESLTIPDDVTGIGDGAFFDCHSLTDVTISSSVTSIGEMAFSGCVSLDSISVAEKNEKYASIDGSLYSKDGKTLVQYAVGKTETSFAVPAYVTSIGNYAFLFCSALTQISLSEGVKSIGEGAFHRCDQLTSITLSKRLTSIGDGAFGQCARLESITIPGGVTSIGTWAFSDCESLASIYFDGDKTTWGNIPKGDGWDDNTGNYTVYCSDSEIVKQ